VTSDLKAVCVLTVIALLLTWAGARWRDPLMSLIAVVVAAVSVFIALH
jgi:Co/Zn/Cd efflux system component